LCWVSVAGVSATHYGRGALHSARGSTRAWSLEYRTRPRRRSTAITPTSSASIGEARQLHRNPADLCRIARGARGDDLRQEPKRLFLPRGVVWMGQRNIWNRERQREVTDHVRDHLREGVTLSGQPSNLDMIVGVTRLPNEQDRELLHPSYGVDVILRVLD